MPPPPRHKPKLKKLRLLFVLVPLALLAAVSTVFGMMMAVASDLPDLENRREYQNARNSVLVDVRGRALGILTNNQSRVLVTYDEISPHMRNAIVAIEDRRFFTNDGVDLRGIARAFIQDLVAQDAVQGGSTITQQFVKNALRAQDERTVFQKMREAAMAYHLTRKWSKAKILTQYLNSIYFGNGAYGVESAARTYFGREPGHQGCGTRERLCSSELRPHEAALLAGVVASPSAYDPVANPAAARRRRDIVLRAMLEQGRLSRLEYFNARREALPGDVRPPEVPTRAPYFTTWVRQQLVDRYGARRAFEGGLRVTTTLDMDLQQAADEAVQAHLPSSTGPSAALVAIDNDTGEVRAMVGGRDYARRPFNLATQGHRQPGSSIKPFILAEALRQGIGTGSLWPSRKREFIVPGTNGREAFVVNNFEGNYAGTQTLASALTYSDNSVYAAVGIQVGTRKVARTARRMGIRTPVSSNPAMTLGGLKVGVSPLDMAHAYETFATRGMRVGGTLGATKGGPVGIRRVARLTRDGGDGDVVARNRPRRRRVLSEYVANTAVDVMATVITSGTGRRAQLQDGTFAAGKTGTTENSGDAWFVGFTDRWTVAVWVGYADRLKPMLTEFGGRPVEGGTLPAIIWHDFVTAANGIVDERIARERARRGLPPAPPRTTTTAPTVSTPPPQAAGATPPAAVAPAQQPPAVAPQAAPQPQVQQPAPAPTPTAAPQPAPTPAPTQPQPPAADGAATGAAPPGGGAAAGAGPAG